MNLEVQGKNKCIAEMMSTVSSYKSKLEIMMTDLKHSTFDHFYNMQDHLKNILILFFRQRTMWPKSVLLSKISEINSVTYKIRSVAEYLSFSFKSDLNIKETADTICEN
jgi:hypothetical protein